VVWIYFKGLGHGLYNWETRNNTTSTRRRYMRFIIIGIILYSLLRLIIIIIIIIIVFIIIRRHDVPSIVVKLLCELFPSFTCELSIIIYYYCSGNRSLHFKYCDTVITHFYNNHFNNTNNIIIGVSCLCTRGISWTLKFSIQLLILL